MSKCVEQPDRECHIHYCGYAGGKGRCSPLPLEKEFPLDKQEVIANYFMDTEFRQTLHEAIDKIVDGAWVTLTAGYPPQCPDEKIKAKA